MFLTVNKIDETTLAEQEQMKRVTEKEEAFLLECWEPSLPIAHKNI